jgi:amino acid adenylation domain-containing protein
MSVAASLERSREVARDGNTVADLFSQQVARTPDLVAVIAGERQLSYEELERRSSVLASNLQALGVVPDTLVGVAMERSEILVISLLAILKAGAAYVPLDPGYPAERLDWIIEDSAMRILLSTRKTLERLSLDQRRIKIVDAEAASATDCTPGAIVSSATGSSLAYVIYTSGSTGKPKGVMVENRNVVSFFGGMDQAIGCEPGTWLAVTSISFDISVLELLWTLCRGFTVVVHANEDTAAIVDEMERHFVTHLQMTPSLARMLALDARSFAALGSLRQLLLGGEAVPVSLIQQVRQVVKGKIYNMYGPTETTIWSTTCRIKEVSGTVPIGWPIAGTQVHLLDVQMNPVPQGDIGELFIAGDGVARGYWNRPDLTTERFVRVPSLSPRPIYRTGDLARCLPDGSLEFLGRADFQIKLRGHRIEPGEIETALEECPGIRQAVVVLREERPGDTRLVAYLVSAGRDGLAGVDLRDRLASRLPDYMIPSNFVFLPSLPLTANGKIDRKALLNLPPPSPSGSEAELTSSQLPSSEMEKIVAGVWQEALGIPSVGVDANFFDLGAHSLTVAEVNAKLEQALGREVALVDLFQFTTVKTLAAHLAGTKPRVTYSDRAQRRRKVRQF